VATIEWTVRFVETHYNKLRRRHLGSELLLVFLAAAGLAFIVLFKPSIVEGIIETIDRMVFQKTDSSSFQERNMWTATSLQALLSTYGLGVGVGGTRSSNQIVAVASNTGIIGAMLYYLFIIQSLTRRAAPHDIEGAVLVSALRYSFVPSFVISLLISPTADFGEGGAFRYGLLTAIGIGGMYAVHHQKHANQTR
ncbi:hypothetical protein JQC81_32670, partial [Microvirga arabica]|nr:hypothetical protein [Microvirga arabica]